MITHTDAQIRQAHKSYCAANGFTIKVVGSVAYRDKKFNECKFIGYKNGEMTVYNGRNHARENITL